MWVVIILAVLITGAAVFGAYWYGEVRPKQKS
jgi:hypothetical protein